MQTAGIQGLSDRDLLVQVFTADQLLGDVDQPITDYAAAEANAKALSDEVDRRFGEGACDNISSWSVVTKASHEDLIQMTKDETEHMIDLARGHACDNASTDRDGHCWCGRQWARMANRDSWYDPNEGADPSLPTDEPSHTEAASELAEALRKASAREQQEWADRQYYGHA